MKATSGPSLVVDKLDLGSDEAPQTAAKIFRSDIQVLRAWAVLVVVFNHARLPFFPGGFLGVDIFFVISGYLMTGLIDETLDNGLFTFKGFYARRVRRLLPAAYATFTVTALAAPFLLDGTEFRNFVTQLIGSFTFTANIVLWQQADYFGTDAILKPLLHIWSLSLEEQYYLVVPIALYLCARRFRLPLSIIVVVLSAAICAVIMTRSVSAAFYLLPSRAWELGIGSVVALVVRRNLILPAPMPLLRLACAAILFIAPLIATEQGHPGYVAAIVCLATGLLLVPGANLGKAEGVLKPLTAVGDRSYSLYLVHWPLFAFASNVFVTTTPMWLNVALMGAAGVWTELQYRFVEQPLRRFSITRRSIAILLLLPIVLIGATVLLGRHMITADTEARTGGSGLARACDYKGPFTASPICISGPAARTLLWGDSFAMAFAPGLAASTPEGIIQTTRTACGSILNLAPFNGGFYNQAWAERCIAFNASIFDYLAQQHEVTTVVLSINFAEYVPGALSSNWRYLLKTPGGFSEQPQSVDALLEALRNTVAELRRLGKRVVLVAPVPAGPFDVARCLERTGEGKPTAVSHQDCTFSVDEYHAFRREILSFLDQVRAANVVPIIDFDEQLCGSGRCQTRLDGLMLYRDKDHLSLAGSRELGKKMGWGHLVDQVAR